MVESTLPGAESFEGALYRVPKPNEGKGGEMDRPINSRNVVLLTHPDQVKVDIHQVMNPLHPDVFNSLRESILMEGILVPILLDKGYAVIDGHNRIQCWRSLLEEGVSIGNVPAVVYDAATKHDALRIAVTTNAVRRDTAEAKPELVRKQLIYLDKMYEAAGDPPDDRRSWSDYRIASTIGIHNARVKDIRARMEKEGEVATATRRVGLQVRNGKRVEVTHDVEIARQSYEKSREAVKAANPVSGRGSDDEVKIKVGRKELTPAEVRRQFKDLRDAKKEIEASWTAAEQKRKDLEAKIEYRTQEAAKRIERQFADAFAKIAAKYGDDTPPEFTDIPDEEWKHSFEEAKSERVHNIGTHLMELYGWPKWMGEYLPGEAASAILDMRTGDELAEALRYIINWLERTVEETEAKKGEG